MILLVRALATYSGFICGLTRASVCRALRLHGASHLSVGPSPVSSFAARCLCASIRVIVAPNPSHNSNTLSKGTTEY